jgi:membrane protease YdiL (CAAX protease family)
VVYAAGAELGGWRLAALGALYALAPAILAGLARNATPGRWQDYAAVLAIWLPVELRWMYKVWPVPRELTHTLTILFALNTGLAAFLIARRLDGIGYSVEWRSGFTANVVLHFLVFGAIAIPLGEAMGFLHFGPPLARVRSLPLDALGILLFTAWPEEFLFRGLIQNLLSRTLKSPMTGWVVASVIFGLSHINNGPFPNWRYVFLATIAGLFYGRVWMKTGTIFTSGLVHGAVDITWHSLFS